MVAILIALLELVVRQRSPRLFPRAEQAA